jgi:hypothetical protein
MMLLPVGLVGMLELAEDSLLSIGAEVDEAGLAVRMAEGTPVVFGVPR